MQSALLDAQVQHPEVETRAGKHQSPSDLGSPHDPTSWNPVLVALGPSGSNSGFLNPFQGSKGCRVETPLPPPAHTAT